MQLRREGGFFMEIGVGIIGWGFMGRTHAYAAMNLPLFYPGAPKPVLRAVASRRLSSAEEAQRDGGFAFATDDWRELLAREDVQAVSVCTPNALHEEMAIEALRAGKHVYIDKPLAVTAESAKRIADAASQSAGISQMAFHCRFFPCVMRAKRLIGEGRIGRVIGFRIAYLHSGSVDLAKPAGWKSDGEQGGVLLDLASHALDMLTYLGGDIGEVLCRKTTLAPSRPAKGGGRIGRAGEDAVTMLVKLRDGETGTLEASKIATGAMDEFRVEINGERGAVRFDLMEPNWLWFYDNTLPEGELGGERGWKRIECVAAYPPPAGSFLPAKNAIGWVRAHVACYHNFIQAIAEGKQPEPSVEQGALIQRVMEACALSDARRGWVRV